MSTNPLEITPGSQIVGYFQNLNKTTPFFPSIAFEIDLTPGVWLVETSLSYVNEQPFVGTETISITTEPNKLNSAVLYMNKCNIPDAEFLRVHQISGVFVINKPTTVFTLLGIDSNTETNIHQTNNGSCIATKIA